MVHAVHDHAGVTTLVDDCWNRIGVRGDQSCPRFATHSRCLNCPVFEEGAAAPLDHALSDADPEAVAQAHHTAVPLWASEHASAELTVLVFRIADGWLALPAAALRQINTSRATHTLPHRRNRVVLGLVNTRGALTVAASLGELLGLDHTGSKYAGHNGYARLFVAAHHDEPAVFPVDEAEGVLRFPAIALLPVPSTPTYATTAHARGVLAWRDVTIGLLDTDHVLDSIARSLR